MMDSVAKPEESDELARTWSLSQPMNVRIVHSALTKDS
jgi:hypothetical protein